MISARVGGEAGARWSRRAAFGTYLLLAMVIAGIFGALHDQLSYSVSREYFTKFKFVQFQLVDTPLPERARAAIVGFLASWWMGIPLGLLTVPAGFLYRDLIRMRRGLRLGLVLIAGFTFLCALCGLGYGVLATRQIDLAAYSSWFVPPDLAHPRRFLCAGYMHNAAYLGGLLAIPVAWAFHLLYALRPRRAS